MSKQISISQKQSDISEVALNSSGLSLSYKTRSH